MTGLSLRQVNLIEETWDYLVINSNQIGFHFYEKLFEIDPVLRELFKVDIETQISKLISTVTYIVHRLNSLDAITKDIELLGRRHQSYNVKPGNYDAASTAMLFSLKKNLGGKWSDEVERAWATAFGVLSQIMIDQLKYENC